MRHITITVSGRVQGVGFRYTTKTLADSLGIVGTVRNLADGRVYIEASGSQAVMTSFLEVLKAGPSPSARVTSLEVVEMPDGFTVSNFSIQ